MATKTTQLQIRVSPAEKQAIRHRAEEAGLGLSAYVLARVLPAPGRRFGELLEALAEAREGEASYALAELNDLLGGLAASELPETVAHAAPDVLASLPEYERNYVAAMVELVCAREDLPPPAWTGGVRPLPEPRFGTDLASLRPHLLRASPVAFKRRNIFIDASVGERV